jgi:pimeloyl-ACP methyl ester carboxylesterase
MEGHMEFQTADGRKIYYEIHDGDGKRGTVVLLHHGFGCTKIWKRIYPDLVEEGYKVIMYDRRGYGQSGPGEEFMKFYLSDEFRPDSVDDMAGFMTFLGISSFHIIGQCEGGVVGVDYATRYPDQVRTLITSSTQCYSTVTMLEKNTRDFKQTYKDLEPELKKKLTEWHGDNAEPFFEQFRKGGGAYGTGVFDLRPSLSKVACPTLVIYPDRSSFFGPEQGVAFFRELEKGELAVLPSCGHNTYEYKPDDYTRLALEFFKRHDPASEGANPENKIIGISCLAVRKEPD